MSAPPPAPVRTADDLEARLGDPWDPAGPASLRQALEDDEAERFPAAAAELDRAGLPAHYVPVALGGQLASYEELLAIVRAVARRDLTLIIGHAKTFLGAAGVWVGGDDDQRRRLAARILAGEPVSLALTERDHGADLLASEVTARRTSGGYALAGEKWLINNATRSTAMTVLATTDPRGGFRGASLFLIEKPALDGRFTHLPKIRTLGIRGADISGIRFDDAPLADRAVIGAPGHGLELTLKLLQLTRTLCAALSLGAADSALRLTLDFAQRRRLYDTTVLELGHPRAVLAGAFADLLACERLARASARAIHLAPEQLPLLSAITKYLVPTRVEACVTRLASVLGARFYLREEHAWGAFQKLLRDHLLVGLFDGSTVVNLHALGLLLRGLTPAAADDAGAAALFGDGPLPPFDPARLEIGCRRSVVAGALPALLDGLAGADAGLHGLAATVHAELAATVEAIKALHARAPARFSRAPELFDLAARYAALHAAASTLLAWWHGRANADRFAAAPDWADVAVRRLLATAGVAVAPPTADALERLAARLVELHARDASFALAPRPLPPRGRP